MPANANAKEEARVLWKMPIILKWVLPGFFIALSLLVGVLQLVSDSPSPVVVLFPVIALGLTGFFAGTIWGWVDEVIDYGDCLIFRKGSTRQEVKLEDIVNISAESLSIPNKVTVLTREPGPLGSSLSFGIYEMFPFREPAVIARLIQRVDQARRKNPVG